MKQFTVEQKELNAALNFCMKAIKPKGALPSYSMIAMRISEDNIQMKAINYMLGLYTSCPVIKGEKFDVAINGQELSHLVGMLHGTLTLTFDILNSRVQIVAPTGKYTLFAEEPKDYPIQDTRGSKQILVCNKEELLDAINSVSPFARPDDIRPALSTVLIDVNDKTTVVGASTVAASKVTLNYTGETHKLMLYHETISALSSISGSDIKISTIDGLFIFEGQNRKAVQIRPTDTYPEYERLFMLPDSTSVNISVSALTASIQRLLSVASAQSRLIRITFETNRVILVGDDADLGRSGEERILAEGEANVTVLVNGNFMLSLLKSRKSSILAFNIIAYNMPIIITGDDNITSLLMPFVDATTYQQSNH